jgi:hypothetical protein
MLGAANDSSPSVRPAPSPPGSRVARGGGPPYDGDVEARVAKLEAGMDDVRTTLGRLEPVLMRIASDTAETKGRLASFVTQADVGKLGEDIWAEMRGDFRTLLTWGAGATVLVLGVVAKGFHWF